MTTTTPAGRVRRVHGLAACLAAAAAACSAIAGVPTSYQAGVNVGNLDYDAVIEASGLVAGHNTPGTLWTHNDSSELTGRVFALDTQGRVLCGYSLTGKANVDFEDIARGPGPLSGATYLYVGDIGNNGPARTQFPVYRFPEQTPDLAWAGSPHAVVIGSAIIQTFKLQYPAEAFVDDKAPDAETLFVDPVNRDLYIVTKVFGSAGVYVAPASSLVNNATITLSLVTTIPLNAGQRITGGDIAPDGSAILLRGLDFALMWERGSEQTIAQALSGAAIGVPVASEPQGEAICFADDGQGYYTLSEGLYQPLYFYAPGAEEPACPADFNNANGVTVQDIFDFLTAWLAGNSSADFNQTNGVTVQDIFDFLTAWLAGC